MLKKQMKTLITMVCVSLLMLTATHSTSAYFTAEEKAHNVITSGGIDIELTEWMEDANGKRVPFENVEGVMPGSVISKIPVVENKGSSEAWVRIKVGQQIDGEEGALDTKVVNINFNADAWTERDGYYYYNEALQPGTSTEPLFTTVAFDVEMGNAYQNAEVLIDVEVHAVQVANNGDSALTAKGWSK